MTTDLFSGELPQDPMMGMPQQDPGMQAPMMQQPDPMQQYMQQLQGIQNPTDTIYMSPLLTEEDRGIATAIMESTLNARKKKLKSGALFADIQGAEIEAKIDLAIKALMQHEINKRTA